MKRKRLNQTPFTVSAKGLATMKRIEAMQRYLPNSLSRDAMALRMGQQYKGVRKIYEALGYPDETDLDYTWFFNKWDRQDIATAVINKPVAKTWSGDLNITEIGGVESESELSVAWKELDKRLKVKKALAKLDALDGIGKYSLLLFGFNDAKNKAQLAQAVGGKLELNYIKVISEGSSKITEWETDSSNIRFGQPKMYELEIIQPGETDSTATIQAVKVHHSRILHVASGSLTSEVYGRSRLKSIANRLEDLEKVLGGDAETFWRGARPGYHAKPESDFTMTTTQENELDEELDKYEHDLRRIIYAEGIDLKALDQQIAEPGTHVDIQLQAISAETGIPKRILVGSERGELSSSQDKDQWLGLVADRRENYAEPEVFRLFIDVCMEHNILTKTEYTVIWSDLFAPSEKEKAEVGKIRADAVKAFFDSPLATERIPIELAMKYILGLSKDQLEEFIDQIDVLALEEDRSMRGVEEEIEDDETLIDNMVKQINQNGKQPKLLRTRTRGSNGQS